MTAYAILAAIAAVLGAFLGLRRKAARERDARVMAEAQRDVAKGRAEVAEAQADVVAEVEARKDAAVEVGEDYQAEVAKIAAQAHEDADVRRRREERTAHFDPVDPDSKGRLNHPLPAGVPVVVAMEPTPAEVIAAADEARRNARTRAKIAAGRKGRT